MYSESWARKATFVLAWAVMLAAAPALADQPAADGSADESIDPARAADPAWQLYDQAFEALAAHDQDSARELLARLRTEFPDHPASVRAASRLAELEERTGPSAGEPVDADADATTDEKHSQRARAELALMMTLHGVLMGVDVCEMLECESSRAWAATLMSTSGAGLGLSLYLTRHGITQGQAQLLDSSVTWGSWNSLLLTDGFAEGPEEAGLQVASQAGGLALGLGLWRAWHPTSGQVALINTGGFWTVILTLIGHGVADEAPDLNTVVLAGDAGLLLAGLLSTEVEDISRGRTLLIDTGGVLGFLTGGLTALIVEPNESGSAFTFMFAGTAAGLGVATYLTRDWDAPEVGSARMSLLPMGQEGWGAALSFDWE